MEIKQAQSEKTKSAAKESDEWAGRNGVLTKLRESWQLKLKCTQEVALQIKLISLTLSNSHFKTHYCSVYQHAVSGKL